MAGYSLRQLKEGREREVGILCCFITLSFYFIVGVCLSAFAKEEGAQTSSSAPAPPPILGKVTPNSEEQQTSKCGSGGGSGGEQLSKGKQNDGHRA